MLGSTVDLLGAVHILRQPPERGGGVSQKLTIADEGGCGSEQKSRKGFYVNKTVDREGNRFRFYHS